MNNQVVRSVLIGLTSALIGVMLIAVGFIARVATEPETPSQVRGRPAATTSDTDFSTLNEVYTILQQDYVDPDRVDGAQLFEAAVNGVFKALGDPHSTYIDPDTYAISRDDFQGAFSGIGATVALQGEFVVIVRAMPNTPAERAGLKAGDAILEVNGEAAEGWSVDKAVLKIRGPRGSTVDLKVRHVDGSLADVQLVRDEITVASVDDLPPGGTLRDGTGAEVTDMGYLRIRSFTNRTPKELSDTVAAAKAKGARGLIIDVRGNPGGLLSETAQTADMFLDKGIIVTQVDRAGGERSIQARSGNEIWSLPVVVVQDEFSASGSELLAAALQENGRATVVGSRSFGKGTVNHARELS
ncbi:MAG: S41 family peptidase, partial [Dehalococcoidia bacterium]|nr:S41 family peptidase [Dehalococcoidia bacterium]